MPTPAVPVSPRHLVERDLDDVLALQRVRVLRRRRVLRRLNGR